MFMDVAAALVGQPKEWALAVWEGWHGEEAALYYAELEALAGVPPRRLPSLLWLRAL